MKVHSKIDLMESSMKTFGAHFASLSSLTHEKHKIRILNQKIDHQVSAVSHLGVEQLKSEVKYGGVNCSSKVKQQHREFHQTFAP